MTLARSSRATTARTARRAPTDLPFVFPDRGLAQALAAEREEPVWLRDDRLAAWKAYDALPIESNQLYTTYVDLRAADLFAVKPYVKTAAGSTTSAEIGGSSSRGARCRRPRSGESHPSDPSISSLTRRLNSIAYSIGSSFVNTSRKPWTMRFCASFSVSPRLIK